MTPGRIAQLLNTPEREVADALKDSRFVKLSLGDEEAFTTANKWDELKASRSPRSPRIIARDPLYARPRDGGHALAAALRNRRAQLSRRWRTAYARETDIVREESTLGSRLIACKIGESRQQTGAHIEEAHAQRQAFSLPT